MIKIFIDSIVNLAFLAIPLEKISEVTINSFGEYKIYVNTPIFSTNPTIIRLPKKSLEKAEDILKKSNNKN